MAIQTVTVTLTAQASATFTFPTPLGNYGKSVGLTIPDGSTAAYTFGTDSPVSGTTTATLNLSGAVTGTAEITIYDRT